MKIRLLIATCDTDYAERLSGYISVHCEDTIDVCVCKVLETLSEALSTQKHDVALMDVKMLGSVDTSSIHLPLLLWSEDEPADDVPEWIKAIPKYQRISSIVTGILEHYAKVSKNKTGLNPETANITAMWSPTGGVGKTTVALAYAASKVKEGRQVLYLNLEAFSSVPAYFGEKGKSISSVFEMLERHEGNVKMLIKGICCCEDGISYLCSPDNFDDIYALSAENVTELVSSCADVTDELIVDLSCECDSRTRQIFELSDKVMLVTDPTVAAQTKLSQFVSQNSIFDIIQEKTMLVANKGAAINSPPGGAVISLPLVQSTETSAVYKALSVSGFSS